MSVKSDYSTTPFTCFTFSMLTNKENQIKNQVSSNMLQIFFILSKLITMLFITAGSQNISWFSILETKVERIQHFKVSSVLRDKYKKIVHTVWLLAQRS